jgi:glyceraldehyde-3-phosphate dehydrogenase (NADP+)
MARSRSLPDAEEIAVHHRCTGGLLARVPLTSPEWAADAVLRAQDAFAELRAWDAGRRAAHLMRLRGLLEREQAALAALICLEAGKPIRYAEAEVQRGMATLEEAALQARLWGGEVVPVDMGAGAGLRAFTHRFPLGPVMAFSPFNFPLNLALHKAAPALALGAPVLLKPSPFTPLTALALEALAEEAGYPPGALQTLLLDNARAGELVRDPRLPVFSFTGSPAAGWHLKELAGPRKRVTLELGGNAAVLVDGTADLADTARKLAPAICLYAGQICISTQRIYAEESCYSALCGLLAAAMEALPSGSPEDPATINGPLIDRRSLLRVDRWVQEAVAQGARVLTGGRVLDAERNVYAPTLLTGVPPDARVVCEEVFGPVAVIEPAADFGAGLREINRSVYGLQAGIFTQDIGRIKLAFNTLEVGAVLANQIPGFRIDRMPYGGVKESGWGREGLRYAMEEMSELRLLVM